MAGTWWASYKAASWAKHRVQGLEGAVLLQAAIDRAQQKASSAQVVILGSPAKRYGHLAATQQIYNAKWESYANRAGLSRTLRERRSLNIPRETLDLRNNMVANLKHDFGQDEQKVA